ncbi:Transposase-like protein [Archaeoglobus sulfaticallidus PM70-1]|uniref:Transposase-like protein n=1 Tax=Archaeoglobus sulfaticallidus PM70-1 TaxID=387631 RepID=N0BIU2_9EURY|nr:IS200/IS605 family transposase [Archaeoglobus sulfaticallidus]AGK60045.1 Transposase-like protein [Archaeoglobus sulfaticallidus PM70-1]
MGRKSSAVYEINYHIVWCPKYRKPVLVDEVREFLEEQIKTIAETKGWEIIELEVMPDHIHLFISAPPFEAPTNIVKILKGVTAKRLFEKFPELREKELWGGHIWSPSYYVGTAGHVSAETIKKYIEGVKNRGRSRNSSTG